MLRAFLPTSLWPAADAVLPYPVVLDEAESNHLANVMRVTRGTPISLLDGAGHVAESHVVQVRKKALELEITALSAVPPPALARILSIALVREQPLDSILQKAVELGVSEIRLIQTAHCVVRLSATDFQRKLPRWTSVLQSSCKQSGNPWMPLLKTAASLDAALALRHPGEQGAFGALRPEAIPCVQWFDSLRTTPSGPAAPALSVWIGPEGDFSAAESDALLAAGLTPLSLGPIVLRVETAAIAMLSGLLLASLRS